MIQTITLATMTSPHKSHCRNIKQGAGRQMINCASGYQANGKWSDDLDLDMQAGDKGQGCWWDDRGCCACDSWHVQHNLSLATLRVRNLVPYHILLLAGLWDIISHCMEITAKCFPLSQQEGCGHAMNDKMKERINGALGYDSALQGQTGPGQPDI